MESYLLVTTEVCTEYTQYGKAEVVKRLDRKYATP